MLCQFWVYSKVIRLYIYIYLFFFKFFSHLGYYRILSRVPCTIQQVPVGYLFYIQQCVHVDPRLPIYPFRDHHIPHHLNPSFLPLPAPITLTITSVCLDYSTSLLAIPCLLLQSVSTHYSQNNPVKTLFCMSVFLQSLQNKILKLSIQDLLPFVPDLHCDLIFSLSPCESLWLMPRGPP